MLPQNRTDHREGDGVSPFPLLDVSSTRDWFDCFCTSARPPAGAGISTAHQRRAPERGATVNRLEHGDMPHEPELRRRKKREAGNGGCHASMTTTVVVQHSHWFTLSPTYRDWHETRYRFRSWIAVPCRTGGSILKLCLLSTQHNESECQYILPLYHILTACSCVMRPMLLLRCESTGHANAS